MRRLIGIDVGGTFTDLVSIDEDGNASVVKTSSTPADPATAIMDALNKAARLNGDKIEKYLSEITRICHGTTISTNTVLTSTGARVGLLTTKGFRDVLEIRTGIRENRYDYSVAQPKPMVPRHLRIGIEERVRSDGSVATPLNEDEVRKAVKYFKKQGVQAISICFLWSFRNPINEIRAAEICREEFPEAYLSVSSEILPELGEYKRQSTVVMNSYVGPGLSKYINHLQDNLRATGYKQQLLITQSNGGVMSPQVACTEAMKTILSGPACGPSAAVFLGGLHGIKNLFTVDMGGTSFDVNLIKDGDPWMSNECAVGGVYHLKLPIVDVHTIGAGGGSLAWLDSKGGLHVGPKSAGANPGPACYMRGGKNPTCCDADMVLGYLNPDFFLGGEIKLNAEASEKAIKEIIADPLGIDTVEAAKGIWTIINASMADAMSFVSVQRGEDPRDYTLLAAGGAGPIHAPSLAKKLGIPRIMVPRTSSVFCAIGSVISDLRHDYVRTVGAKTDEADINKINALYKEMEDIANETLATEGMSPNDRYFIRSMDMRYIGQFHEVNTEVPNKVLSQKDMPKIVDRFSEKHESLYAYKDIVGTEIIFLRLAAFGRVVKTSFKEQPYGGKDSSKYIKSKRDVLFDEETDYIATTLYDGDALKSGNLIEGPAIIEQVTTTISLPPGFKLEVSKYGDFIVEVPVEIKH